MHIRPAIDADLEVVCDYNARLAAESEGKTLDFEVLRRGVAAVLADANKGIYFLAEIDGRVVGQICVTYEWSDWRNGWFWWVQSVYVEREFRRRGVFASLYRHVETAAQASKVIGIRLYVESDNHTAHATYEKLGLKWTTYRVMEKYPLP